MLPTAARLRNSDEFRTTVRRGVRVGRPTLVVHADLAKQTPIETPSEQASAKVGFVVSKKVGNAVTRNRVKRRLRHLVRDKLVQAANQGHPVDGAMRIVVRALPAAALEPQRLARDLASAFDAALDRTEARAKR